jgi:ferredoxin-NADP reductase
MAMLRHHRNAGSQADMRLLLSSRTREDVLYREELEGFGDAVHLTLTREKWDGWSRHIDAEMLREVGPGPDEHPHVYVCGPTAFVEEAARLLVELGHLPAAVHTERFG